MSGPNYPIPPDPDGYIDPQDYEAYLVSLYENQPPQVIEEIPEDFELRLIANSLSAAADGGARAASP